MAARGGTVELTIFTSFTGARRVCYCCRAITQYRGSSIMHMRAAGMYSCIRQLERYVIKASTVI